MSWKPKNETCGVPGKGFIKAESYTQEDENNLIQRAKRRGIDVTMFMLAAGFVPAGGPQLPLIEDDEFIPDGELKPKRKRRTKAEMEAEG